MNWERTVIATDQAPAAVGPYSQAIRAGKLVFTAGQIGLDPSSARLVEGGIGTETRQALNNIRAILEAIACTVKRNIDVLEELGIHIEEIRCLGGGSRSPLWNQIKADVLGVPYQRLARSEFATWGAAMVAGRAVGLFEDLAETAKMATAPAGEPTQPRPEVAETYKRLAGRYDVWQEMLAGAFRSLAESEWSSHA